MLGTIKTWFRTKVFGLTPSVDAVLTVFTEAIDALGVVHDMHRETALDFKKRSDELRSKALTADNEAERAIRLKFRLEELLDA